MSRQVLSPYDDAGRVKPYLDIRQLAQLWRSEQAIRKKVQRGELRLGIEYFQPNGPGSDRIFKWDAVRAHIEGCPSESEAESGKPAQRRGKGRVLNVEKATENFARRLRGEQQ